MIARNQIFFYRKCLIKLNKKNMNSAKLEYINFCKSYDSSINIFHKSWWLDSVCGKLNWDVALYKKDNEIWLQN